MATALRIDFTRSGGFIGLRSHAAIDTSELPEADAKDVQRILENVDFTRLGTRHERKNRSADAYNYKLTVTGGGESKTIILSEGEVPRDLRPLIDRLSSLARPQPIEPRDQVQERHGIELESPS